MGNNQRNSRKRLNSLVLLVAFTAVMLIVSTYAWFSAQKNVTIGGLTGQVNVAEGLEISLDAKYWSQEVNFADTKYTNKQEDLKKLYAIDKTFDDGNLTASDPEHNIIPTDMVPVSTTGLVNDGIKQQDMNFYRGINQNTKELYQIIKVQQATDDEDRTAGRVYTAYPAPGAGDTAITSAHHDYPGYYAIDLFLRNSTKDVSTSDAVDGLSVFNKTNFLQLNSNSRLELQSSSAVSTGLQSTVRVAFALYNMNEDYDQLETGEDEVHEGKDWNDVVSTFTKSAYMTASQKQILNAYANQTINDVAIWEPNASNHAQYIVDQYRMNKTMTWLAADQTTYGIPTENDTEHTPPTFYKDAFGLTTPLPTYALTSTATSIAMADGADDGETAGDSVTDTNAVKVGEGSNAQIVAGIQDIYNWSGTKHASLVKQVTLQTEKAGTDNYSLGKVKQLVSVTSPNTTRYTWGGEAGAKKFAIPSGKVCKIRMYVWLEGQDVDTINHASHGGGIEVDVGLIKDATPES